MLTQLQRPRFMIFDYGETLAHEDDYSPGDGFAAILPYAVKNPTGADAAELLAAFSGCYKEIRRLCHEAGAEIPNLARWRWLFEMYDLEFSLSAAELERVFWDAAAPCVPTPGSRRLLELLRSCGIGTGVVSNMGFSGTLLQSRLEKLFPEHRFEFVISSSDYVLRKPNSRLFQLALKKTGCAAEEVWFAGDNPAADIAGAAAAGMTALYYDCDLGCAYREQAVPDVMPRHLRIENWSELYAFFGA